MNLSRRVLGAYVVQALAEKASAPLLKIGSDVFYRHDFAQIDCFNFVAAANLSAALKSGRFANLQDLYERLPPSSLLLPRVGPVALAVLGAAFELKGIGGSAPLESWMKFHQADDAGDHITTFSNLKSKQRREEERSKPARSRSGRRSILRRRTSSVLPSAALMH